jgi:hypothetical protein
MSRVSEPCNACKSDFGFSSPDFAISCGSINEAIKKIGRTAHAKDAHVADRRGVPPSQCPTYHQLSNASKCAALNAPSAPFGANPYRCSARGAQRHLQLVVFRAFGPVLKRLTRATVFSKTLPIVSMVLIISAAVSMSRVVPKPLMSSAGSSGS